MELTQQKIRQYENRNKIYKLKEMDADHVTAWSNGGATDITSTLIPVPSTTTWKPPWRMRSERPRSNKVSTCDDRSGRPSAFGLAAFLYLKMMWTNEKY
jgi:hypothetical protein